MRKFDIVVFTSKMVTVHANLVALAFDLQEEADRVRSAALVKSAETLYTKAREISIFFSDTAREWGVPPAQMAAMRGTFWAMEESYEDAYGPPASDLELLPHIDAPEHYFGPLDYPVDHMM